MHDDEQNLISNVSGSVLVVLGLFAKRKGTRTHTDRKTVRSVFSN